MIAVELDPECLLEVRAKTVRKVRSWKVETAASVGRFICVLLGWPPTCANVSLCLYTLYTQPHTRCRALCAAFICVCRFKFTFNLNLILS